MKDTPSSAVADWLSALAILRHTSLQPGIPAGQWKTMIHATRHLQAQLTAYLRGE